jgi:integrase
MAKVAKRRGRYVLDFYDNEGKRRWVTLPEGAKRKDANKALREIEDQLEKGSYISQRKIPIFSDIAQAWLKAKEMNVRSTTWNCYQGHINNHLAELNPLQVNQITTARVEKYISDRQKAGMNLTTLKKVITTLGQIMSYAVRHKYIDHNPVRDAERPRGQGDVESDTNEIKILKPHEIALFLEAVRQKKYQMLFKLAIMSGARQGELLGLKWSDIDFDKNQIHIQRTFNMGQWFEPKTKTSKRRIDIGPRTMADLKKWRIACPPTSLDLVFPNKAGKPIGKNELLKHHFNPALKRASLPRMRFHDLRHTFASLLIEQGENTKYIQTQLGHSSPTVTLNVYAHLMNTENQKSASKLESTVFG